MANAIIGALRVVFGADTAAFEKGATEVERRMKRTQKNLEATADKFTSAGTALTVGLTAPLVAFGATAVKAAMESADALSQVENTLRTMGGTAGKTTGELQKLAASQMGKSLYDDDQILRQVTNTMLTFGQISGQTFDRAQQAAIDLSAKFGKDLQSSAIMVGKALNDPIKGVTALQKTGISFTEQQKEQIKAMAEVGNIAGAQALILAELDKQVAGSAQAARDANPFGALQQEFAAFQETVGAELVKVLPQITGAITAILQAFGSLSPEMQKAVIIGGALAATLGPIALGIGGLVSGFSALMPVFTALAPALVAVKAGLLGIMANPYVLAGAAVITGIYLAWKNWDKIKEIVVNLYNAVKRYIVEGLGRIWDGVLNKVDSVKKAFYNLYDAVVGHSYIPDMVDGIAVQMQRLDAVMVSPVKNATEAAKQAFEKLKSDVQGIMGNLFPDARQVADFRNQLKALDAGIARGGVGGYSADQLKAGRARLIGGASNEVLRNVPLPLADQLARFGNVPLGNTQGIQDALEKMTEAANDNAKDIGTANVRIVESFKDMAQGAMSSINSLVSAVKGGGFWNILSGVLNFGLDLAGMGVFGKGAKAFVSGIPGRAIGGNIASGRPYVVGERGPELFVPSSSGAVLSNKRMGAGGSSFVVNVDARGSADPAAVRQQVERGILEAAPAIIAAAEARTVSGLRRPRLGGAMQ